MPQSDVSTDANSETHQNKTTQPTLITAAEMANMMNISVRTLWRLLSAGELIQPIRIGGNTRWRLEQVRQWIAEGCPPPPGTG